MFVETAESMLEIGITMRHPHAKVSDLEARFLLAWRAAGFDRKLLTREYKFCGNRQWRFDFCHYTARVAVELEGGTFGVGKPCHVCKRRQAAGHQTAAGMDANAEKYNAAAELGWLVLRYTRRMLDSDPLGCAEQVMDVIKGRVSNGPERRAGD